MSELATGVQAGVQAGAQAGEGLLATLGTGLTAFGKSVGSIGVYLMAAQVLSAGICAGLNVDSYCQIEKSINDTKNQIEVTKKEWDDAISEDKQLTAEAVQNQNQNFLIIQKMAKATHQLQNDFISQSKALKLTIFTLVLGIIGSLVLKGILEKQKKLKIQ